MSFCASCCRRVLHHRSTSQPVKQIRLFSNFSTNISANPAVKHPISTNQSDSQPHRFTKQTTDNRSSNQPNHRLNNGSFKLRSNQTSNQSRRNASNPLNQQANNQTIDQTIKSPGHLEWERSYQSIKQSVGPVDRFVMFCGASLLGLMDTHRADLVGMVGETAPLTDQSINQMYQTMKESTEGQCILHDKPRLIDNRLIDRLITLPVNTLGHQYALFMQTNQFTPSSRVPVRFITRSNNQTDISELDAAYIVQRYREVHDLWHVLTCNDADVLGELAQKVFECQQTGLPMTGLAAIGGSVRLSGNELKQYVSEYVPWGLRAGEQAKSLMPIYWERRWMQDIDEIRKELNIEMTPKRWQ